MLFAPPPVCNSENEYRCVVRAPAKLHRCLAPGITHQIAASDTHPILDLVFRLWFSYCAAPKRGMPACLPCTGNNFASLSGQRECETCPGNQVPQQSCDACSNFHVLFGACFTFGSVI